VHSSSRGSRLIMRGLFRKAAPSPSVTVFETPCTAPQGGESVCVLRRRLSAMGTDIGFESDGAVLIEPEPQPEILSKPTDMVKHLSFVSRAGKVPQNPKKVNQDRCWAMDLLDRSGHIYKFCGVADGHGVHGHSVAEMVRTHLGIHLEKQLPLYADSKIAMHNAHERMSRDILNSYLDVSFSGTTSVSVLMRDNTIICANLGDSRAVMGSKHDTKWKATALSRDHKPDLPDEAKRIADRGGRVMAYRTPKGDSVGPARVWLKSKDVPGLAMSRSFGDKVAASVGVSAQPEFVVHTLVPGDKFLIIATDGVWEFVSNHAAVEMVVPFLAKGDTKGAAELLCNKAEERWLEEGDVVDDITAVVLFF